MRSLLIAFLLAASACVSGYAVRIKGAEAAHQECAEKGWRWETEGPVEEGPTRDSKTGAVTGGALFTYACTDPAATKP